MGVHFAYDTFAHVLWGSTKPVLVLTDNKSLTRFSQAITIPSGLWTCVDHVLNFNFVLGHIPGKANAAAGYLFCVRINPHFNIQTHFNAKLPVREVTLTMGMQVPANSLNTLYLNCEILMTPQKLKHFPLNRMPYMLLVRLIRSNFPQKVTSLIYVLNNRMISISVLF